MREWLISITATIIISLIILLILPEGKLYGIIKSIFSILALLTIISPIIKLEGIKAPEDFIFGENNIILEENYLDYMDNEKIKDIKSNCIKIIQDYYSNQIKIDIEFYRDNQLRLIISKITIDLSNAKLNNFLSNSNAKEEITQKISAYLSIEKVKIKFNE